jgi:putative ABC transport system substrate-binding protein
VLAGKRLELLKETIPKLSRVVVLWDPQDRGSMQQWKESQLTAKELGL